MTYREIKRFVESYEPDFYGALDGDDFDVDLLPRSILRWITHELIPSIVRTGAYEFPADLDTMQA